jgi:hypothetical protein
VDQQSSSLSDDLVLDNEVLWLKGMFGEEIFKLEKWIVSLNCRDDSG